MTVDAFTESTRPSRMDRLYRRWSASRSRRGGSPALDPESTAWLVGLVSMLPLIPLDSALLGYAPDGANAVFRMVDGWSVALVLASSAALQAWCVERGLWARTPEPWTVRRRVRWLRPWLAAVPLAGLYVVALWEELTRSRPSWAFDAERVRASYRSLESRPAWLGRHLHEVRPRWFGFLWSQLGLFFLGLLTTLVWAQWLWHAEIPSRRLQLVVGSALFHGLGFASMAYALWQHSRRPSTSSMDRWALTLLSVFWLVPLPLFGLIGLVLLASFGDRREALAGQALTAAGSSPRWLAFREDLRGVWDQEPWWQRLLPRKAELEETPKATEQVAKLYLFARLKCLLLLVDGAALALGLSWLGKNRPELAVFLDMALLVALVLAFIAGCVAAILAGIRFVRRLLRDRGQRPPYSHYVSLSSLSFFTGIVLGKLMERQDVNAIGGLLLTYGGTGLVLTGLRPLVELVLPLSPEDPTRSRQVVGWTLGYGSLAILGLGLAASVSGPGDGLVELPRFQLPGLALVGVVLSVSFLGWVLRPRKLRDIVREGSTLGTRTEIVFLTLTAVLPLGGLAVPAWLRLRREWLEYR